MLFNSVQYLVFFSVIFMIYWAVPNKYRIPLILFGSYFFYMCWDAKYIVLIIGITLISYFGARILSGTQSSKVRKITLVVVCMLCLSTLFFFKYLNFTIDTVNRINSMFGISRMQLKNVSLVLPVGISFFTFQSMSYVIDVYRAQTKEEKNLITYATFVSFFPQLVAGPIERSSNLLPQIKSNHQFDYDSAMEGFFLIIWGMMKKVAIADIAAKYVDYVYLTPKEYKGFDLILAVVLFTIQIYCDFSGYTDIAIGSAKMLGISLMDNFRAPYFSKSVKEYWSRWHISLSTWFRDYVYIPLGGNRCSSIRRDFNLMITFLASGLWHGANWTFVVWGGLHGLAQVAENRLHSLVRRCEIVNKNAGFRGWVLKISAWFVCFFFINLSWIPFRAGSISDAIYVLSNVFCVEHHSSHGLLFFKILETKEIVIILINLLLLSIFDIVKKYKDPIKQYRKLPLLIKICIGYLIFADIMLVVFNGSGNNQFVYFQF